MALYSRPRNTRLLVVSLVMLSLLTITVDYKGGEHGPLEDAGKGALSVVGALQGAVTHVIRPVTNWVSGVIHIGSLRAENDDLKRQISALKVQAAQDSQVQRRLVELEGLLKIRDQLQPRKSVTGTVIAQSPGNFEWTITISQGSSAGIKEDMPVISGNGLVGHVINVTANVSVVQLILDPDSAVAARLASAGDTGVILGQRDRPLRMDLVDPNANVSLNEPVVTSGYEVEAGKSIYPPGITVGFVSHIAQQINSLEKTIEITPAVDFSALEYVLVIVKS
jgi:rod shape-determining protein MreC